MAKIVKRFVWKYITVEVMRRGNGWPVVRKIRVPTIARVAWYWKVGKPPRYYPYHSRRRRR